MEFLRLAKNGSAERRSQVPPLLILKTKDLQRDCAQSRANDRLIRKVLEIQELPVLPCRGRSGHTGCSLVVKEPERASSPLGRKGRMQGSQARSHYKSEERKTMVTKLS